MNSNFPQRLTHKGVEIRYGYSVIDDQCHAHFDLPELERRIPNVVHTDLRPSGPGPQHLIAKTEQEVIDMAKRHIDRYFE